MKPRLFCLIGFSLIGIFFLNLSTQLYEYTEELEDRYDFDAFKMTQLNDPAMSFEQQSKHARKNVIIMSHGRSGSTLMGDIFNHHPSVFYMYEPLQTAQRVKGKSSENTNYSSIVEQYLTGVFRCKFDQPHILADIEKYYRKPDHPRISQAIASPPLCPYNTTDPRWDPKLCYPMTSESLGSACTKNYDLTVIKVLISRIPENSIKTILSLCNPLDVDCKVVFLIRDPRAVIPSSLNVGFFKEKGNRNALLGTRMFSYQQCQQTEDNLDFIRKLPNSLRNRIKVQRYEDLAINPLKVLSGLYEFAGLPVLESVRTWLNETTQSSRRDCNHEKDGVLVTCTKDDAWAAANRWRWKVHPHEIDVIEHYCGGLLRMMGYKPVDRNYELLVNKEVPLFSDEYEAKHWFLH